MWRSACRWKLSSWRIGSPVERLDEGYIGNLHCCISQKVEVSEPQMYFITPNLHRQSHREERFTPRVGQKVEVPLVSTQSVVRTIDPISLSYKERSSRYLLCPSIAFCLVTCSTLLTTTTKGNPTNTLVSCLESLSPEEAGKQDDMSSLTSSQRATPSSTLTFPNSPTQA